MKALEYRYKRLKRWNLDEVCKFYNNVNDPKLKERLENLNVPVTMKQTESVI